MIPGGQGLPEVLRSTFQAVLFGSNVGLFLGASPSSGSGPLFPMRAPAALCSPSQQSLPSAGPGMPDPRTPLLGPVSDDSLFACSVGHVTVTVRVPLMGPWVPRHV